MSKNPRPSITLIVMKVQSLTLRTYRYYEDTKDFTRTLNRVTKAAVNEILRLEAESELAAERAIPKLNKRFDEIDKK